MKNKTSKTILRCFLTCLTILISKIDNLYSTQDVYIYKIKKSFQKEIAKYGMPSSHLFISKKDEKIDVFQMEISVYQLATIEEARELVVVAFERLYQIINEIEDTAKYSNHYPLNKNKILLGITFDCPSGLGNFSGNVNRAVKSGTTIFYDSFDFIFPSSKTIFEENYEDAKNLISLPITPKKFKHAPFGYEDLLMDVVDLFTIEMLKKYNLSPIMVGGQFHKQISSIGVRFCMIQRTPLEEARALQVKCINRLLDLVNADEKLRPYLKKWPMTAEDIEIRLEFWKHKRNKYSETGGYYADGSICYCYVQDGKISYFDRKPPEGHLRMPALLLQESFEEANQKLVN